MSSKNWKKKERKKEASKDNLGGEYGLHQILKLSPKFCNKKFLMTTG
jgi:hypothetical protein